MASNCILQIPSVWQKLARVEEDCHRALNGPMTLDLPELPARDIEFLPVGRLPAKIGLSDVQGQQKLLHDLANIELQAMELGLRTLMDFPAAELAFKEQLVEIILEEAKHLRLCLESLESLGGRWGQWPVHLGLHAAVSGKDTLLERIFIVHRYLEGSGLDAGDAILRRLSGVPNKIVRETVKLIVREEVKHVEFGSRWFNHYCADHGVDKLQFFARKTRELLIKNPRPGKLAEALRRDAGFTMAEIQVLDQCRAEL